MVWVVGHLTLAISENYPIQIYCFQHITNIQNCSIAFNQKHNNSALEEGTESRNIGKLCKWSGHLHSNTIRSETTRGRLVLKPTEVVIVTHGFKLGVVFERMNNAFAFYCVGTLDVIMIGQKYLLLSMKLLAPAHGFFRPVVPPHANSHIASAIGLNFLYLRNVRQFVGILTSHENRVSHCQQPNYLSQ